MNANTDGDGVGWIERAKLKKQKEKAIFEDRLKVFQLDDARKAIALRALENAPHKLFHADFFVLCYEVDGAWKCLCKTRRIAGKQCVDYAAVGDILIQQNGWPFGDCKHRLLVKLREWNESTQGSRGGHATRQQDYLKRKVEPDNVQPSQKPIPAPQRAIANALDRLERLTLEEKSWRANVLQQCEPSPEPQPVVIPVGTMQKTTVTTFQKEFKKAHMRVWSAMKEMPKVCERASLPSFWCSTSCRLHCNWQFLVSLQRSSGGGQGTVKTLLTVEWAFRVKCALLS